MKIFVLTIFRQKYLEMLHGYKNLEKSEIAREAKNMEALQGRKLELIETIRSNFSFQNIDSVRCSVQGTLN
jgi:hypothetical protein